ncbi:MAG TPA: LarC family nickel insertion protein, partial [Candidatus Baltobacteraceae bacterium]|nr:LarC family nickel insertion protein [Candidatus Baltobacteraceae bacterium]
MNAAYFEMIGGASGNMLLGALLDAGADRGRLEAALRTVPVAGWKLECRRVVKRGIAATFFDFEIPGEDHTPPLAGFSHEHEHDHEQAHSRAERRLEDVLDILDRSGLSEWQKTRARTIYVRLAQAEARVHGKSVEHVVFHEVGQIDAILDVAGACVALDLLEVESVFCSPFPIGEGSIAMTHGAYPNPPPATAELLRGAPTFAAGVVGEMVTTTGAAILTALVQTPGTRPPMTAERIGYGAGRSDFAIPNVLRASIGPLFEAPAGADEIVVLEATID